MRALHDQEGLRAFFFCGDNSLTKVLQYMFVEWFIWCGIIKSLFFAFIIASVSAFFGYTVEGGSIEVGKASTDSVVCSSVLILFADLILTQLLMG